MADYKEMNAEDRKLFDEANNLLDKIRAEIEFYFQTIQDDSPKNRMIQATVVGKVSAWSDEVWGKFQEDFYKI